MKKFLSLLMSLALLVTLLPVSTLADEGGYRNAIPSKVLDAALKFAGEIDGILLSTCTCGRYPMCCKHADGTGFCHFDLQCGSTDGPTIPNNELYNTILPELISKCGSDLQCELDVDGRGWCKMWLDCNKWDDKKVNALKEENSDESKEEQETETQEEINAQSEVVEETDNDVAQGEEVQSELNNNVEKAEVEQQAEEIETAVGKVE